VSPSENLVEKGKEELKQFYDELVFEGPGPGEGGNGVAAAL
jgi:hypothetical protein